MALFVSDAMTCLGCSVVGGPILDISIVVIGSVASGIQCFFSANCLCGTSMSMLYIASSIDCNLGKISLMAAVTRFHFTGISHQINQPKESIFRNASPEK